MKNIEPVIEGAEDAQSRRKNTSQVASGRPERRRAPFLPWLLVILVLLGSLVVLAHNHFELQALREQLVATQDSFAEISEEATGRILSLSGQVDDLPALHARLQGMSGQLAELRAHSRQLAELQTALQRLSGQVAERERHAQLLEKALAGQSDAIEQAAQVLDAGRRELEQQLAGHVQQADRQYLALQEDLALLRELQESGSARMDALASGLDLLNGQADRLDRQQEDQELLGQALLQQKEQLARLRTQQEDLQKEMSAFRAQVTRNQDRLQQRLDDL